MALFSDEGIILRHYPLGETGLIVIVATPHHGIRHLVAKGARRPKNTSNTPPDLFYHIHLSWSHSPRAKNTTESELGLLRESRLLNPRPHIRLDYPKTVLATYFTRLWERSMEAHDPSPELYNLLERALNYLDTQGQSPTPKALHHFENELARLHGILEPNTDAHYSLKHYIGSLPKQREQALALLTPPQN